MYIYIYNFIYIHTCVYNVCVYTHVCCALPEQLKRIHHTSRQGRERGRG